MICRLIKLPFRLAEEAIWMARAAAEMYGGYGVEEPYVWALTNDEIDAVLKDDHEA